MSKLLLPAQPWRTFATGSLGIGYLGGSLILLTLLLFILGLWRYNVGSISVGPHHLPRVELFYWMTIFSSNTLGTALGDWLADSAGVGFERAALVLPGPWLWSQQQLID